MASIPAACHRLKATRLITRATTTNDQHDQRQVEPALPHLARSEAHHNAAPPSSKQTTAVNTRAINESPLSTTTAATTTTRRANPASATHAHARRRTGDRATGWCSVGAHRLPHRYRALDGTPTVRPGRLRGPRSPPPWDDGALPLQLSADCQESLPGRRRTPPCRLSSMAYQQAPQGKAPMNERS
jgi:hypothetical protein